MKQALILQGWYQKTTSNWYPWLKTQLEQKQYKVFLPELPTIYTDLPNWQLIEQAIEKTVTIDENTVIIGHSLSCLMALKLAEKHKFKQMILVAGWDFNDLTPEHKLFWKKSIDHAKIISNVENIVCISSDNDPYFTWITAESMSQRLNGKAILVKGAGHFNDEAGIKKLPQVLEILN